MPANGRWDLIRRLKVKVHSCVWQQTNGSCTRTDFLVAAIMKLTVFCNVMFSSEVETSRRFEGTYWFDFKDKKAVKVLFYCDNGAGTTLPPGTQAFLYQKDGIMFRQKFRRLFTAQVLAQSLDNACCIDQWRTEGGSNTPPPREIRSFDKVEPDCKLSGKYLVFLFQLPNQFKNC